MERVGAVVSDQGATCAGARARARERARARVRVYALLQLSPDTHTTDTHD